MARLVLLGAVLLRLAAWSLDLPLEAAAVIAGVVARRWVRSGATLEAWHLGWQCASELLVA